ncbi:hypothetical protein GBAR_LOCUS4520 [Geodia barretti]|uniref:Spermatogenesis-associated protein 6 N-terminal domain-containing protein n=1 Tax=Geodia barretti TaxID=519541 RepID=A0AA35W8P1_GEOBA|nr:hypothetical protein GBAR_LOCUS4520 [Geodia barretti]
MGDGGEDTLRLQVLTNCSDPSLLREIITGEHVFLEMVQVTEDYEGGRILARYEAPADEFLFPEVPLRPGQLRTLSLNKSRNYQYCPQLMLTTSTAVTKITIATPFPLSSPWKPPIENTPMKTPNPAHNTRRPPNRQMGVAATDKLHLLLDSYAEPHPEYCLGGGAGESEIKEPPGKIRPPNSKSSIHGGSFGGRKLKVRGTLTTNPGGLYHCCTVSVGPHEWTSCPRRSYRQQSQGVHGRCSQRGPRSKSAPSLELVGEPENLDPSQRGVATRPFMAGRVDRGLLAKRDFCGQTPGKMAERESRGGGGGRVMGRGKRGWTRVNVVTSRKNETSLPQYGAKIDEPTPTERCHTNSVTPPPDDVVDNNSGSEATSSSGNTSGDSSSSCDSHVTGSERGEEPPSQSDDDITSDTRRRHSPQAVTSISCRRQRHHLLSKYLSHQNGNGGMGMDPSPTTLIEHKLQTLIQDCCECRRSAEGLGRDDMSEDDDRLRASLSAEREDLLNKSAKLIPEKSVLVGLGGEEGEDYWSQKMAQFQGKHHRLVFNETMEKIYSRLYQRAINMK